MDLVHTELKSEMRMATAWVNLPSPASHWKLWEGQIAMIYLEIERSPLKTAWGTR